MKDLFLFAGQSNMMGAGALSPEGKLKIKKSFEYKHKGKYLGISEGDFVPVTYDIGEFSYKDPEAAYGGDFSRKSKLTDYASTTYFCPSMSNLADRDKKSTNPFRMYSEDNYTPAPSFPALFVKEWEKKGRECLICNLSKGGVSIRHFFDHTMIDEVNSKLDSLSLPHQEYNTESGSSEYFFKKAGDFIRESCKRFPDISKEICLFFLQGESDSRMPKEVYKTYLEVFYRKLNDAGITKFFCIRVGFWGKEDIIQIMRAQEEFCAEQENAYLVTRLCSYFPFPGMKNQYRGGNRKYASCRDSYYGYPNKHINAKGHSILARRCAKNVFGLLYHHKEIKPEKERVLGLLELQQHQQAHRGTIHRKIQRSDN